MDDFKNTKIPLFRRCVIQNFPFIEEDFDALTDYGLLCKIVEYLNEVINSTNATSEQVEYLTNSFNTLKNYVDNYFENLDVQEEINNKIENMVSTGEFQLILDTYINPRLNELSDLIESNYTELDTKIDNTDTSLRSMITSSDANLQTQINSLASGSPLTASSTAGMTDTTRVYVNTTDGKWYYYNGAAWVAGGTYQATGLAANSVNISNLSERIRNNEYYKSTDISKLGFCASAGFHVTNGDNFTSPIIVTAGTTISFSNDFLANYKWKIDRCDDIAIGSQIKAYNTDSSYTFVNDERCIIRWQPRDENWATTTYTVDRLHKLDSDDVTSITFYYPKDGTTVCSIADFQYMLNSCMGRTLTSWSGMAYSTNRFGNIEAMKTKSPVKVTITDDNFDYSIQILSERTESDTGPYHIVSDSNWLKAGYVSTIPANTMFGITVRLTDNGDITTLGQQIRDSLVITDTPTLSDIPADINYLSVNYDKYVKGIAHRGYSYAAPENTLPAFKLAVKNGFKYIESDVQFTSDSVPVMIHDSTIDRTSNGSGTVSEMTYSEISQYDFGSWAGAQFAGTAIPTLYDFLKCLHDLGANAYIELKQDSYTSAQLDIILNAIKSYNMSDSVTFTSFSLDNLTALHAKDPKARLGYVTMYPIDSTAISNANSLKNDNEVFIDIHYIQLSTDGINLAKNAGLPVEAWTIDNSSDIIALNSYVSGVYSDKLLAGKVLFDNTI